MSRKYKFGDSTELYFISFAVIHWIDLFIRKEYKDIVLDSWRFCQKEKGLEIYGWCIMSSHVHMIVVTAGRPLEKTIGEMKSFTSRSLRKAIENNPEESRKEWIKEMMLQARLNNNNNNDWQLWQQYNHPIELRNSEIFHQKLQYVHDNPVEAGYVEKEEEYLYSSARDFYGKKGLIELSYIV
jgi:putative transposase